MKKSLTFFIIFILFLFLFTLGIFFLQSRGRGLTTDSYIYINLSGRIPETPSGSSPFVRELTLRDIYRALEKGKSDSKIRGCFLKISYPQIGFGEAEEIRRLIFSFKKTGKKTVAFIEFGGDLDYFIATAADKIYTFPGSFIELNGVAGERIYYRGFFRKLGIKPQFYHIGKWKTAVNSYTEDKMTSEEKEQLIRIIKGIMDYYTSEVQKSRGIKREEFLRFMNEEGGGIGEDFKNGKFFDGVESEGEVLKTEFKGLQPVRAKNYASMGIPFNPNRIAVVCAEGTINIGRSGDFPFTGKIIGSESLRRLLSRIKKNRSVKAVVLRINSPGGSAIASEEIERAVKELSKKKPVVVSMSSYAASGGYYIAVDGRKIFANNLTLTGSIGIIGGKFSFKGALEKLGMRVDSVTLTRTALINSPFRDYSQNEYRILKKRMWSFYNLFVRRVAEGRGKKPEYIDSIGRGRVFLGMEAVKIGLVDKIGGLEDAIEEAAKEANLRFYSVEFYPKKKSLLESLIDIMKGFNYSQLRTFLNEGVYFLLYPYYRFN